MSNLEELEIIDTTTTKQEMQTFDSGVLLNCKKLNKLIYRTEIDSNWDDDPILIAKTIKRRLHQVENVLKKISLNQKLECLSVFTHNGDKWSSEKGVLLHLSVQILSFNGLKISPNLKAININEIELLLNN